VTLILEIVTKTFCTLFILLIVTFYLGLWTLLISFYPHLSNRFLHNILITKTTQTWLSIYSFYDQTRESSIITKSIQSFVSLLTISHSPSILSIIIDEEFIQVKRYTIIKSSEEETKFIFDLIKGFKNIDTSNISDKDSLEHII